MRIALVQFTLEEKYLSIPLGLLCLASYIKQRNHQPIIINFNSSLKNHKIPFNFFKSTAKKILKHAPQILGFSATCSTLPALLLIAKECKKITPRLPIIFGGPDVSFEDTEIIKIFRQVDIIVRGEGEIALAEILSALENNKTFSGIPGITYREENTIIRNPDRQLTKNLDELPLPDYSLLPDLEKYQEGQIEAGRGCPYRCTFCSTCKMWKTTFRIKSPHRLAEELKKAHAVFGKNGDIRDININIIHDNFLVSRKNTEKFLSLISNKGIPWTCSSRLEHLDEKLIQKLKSAGCQRIFLGIESGSPKIQKEIKKNLPLSRLPQILETLSQNDIQATLSFIVGFPNENKSQINRTLLIALRSTLYSCSPFIQIHPLILLKGSELYSSSKGNFFQRDFWQTDVSQLVTPLPAELSLIKKYPQIFPSFYHISKKKNLQTSFLEEICNVLAYFIDTFPLTTLLLLKFLKTDPLSLGKKIFRLFKTNKPPWFSLDDESAFRQYVPPFKNFIERNSNMLIKETFTHEELFEKSHFTEGKATLQKNKISYRSRPRINEKIIIKQYNYPLLKLLKKLKKDTVKNIKKDECFIAYIPGQTTRATEISSLGHALLLMCNGKRSIQDMLSLCYDNKEKNKKASKIFLKEFEILQQEGIISFPNES